MSAATYRHSSPRPQQTRNRSSTVTGIRQSPFDPIPNGPPAHDRSHTAHRVITEPSTSAAQAALSTLNSSSTIRRPRLQTNHTNHTRGTSWPDPPSQLITTPSVPAVPTQHNLTLSESSGNATPQSHIQLLLYTYKPPQTNPSSSQPSPLPSKSTQTVSPQTQVLLNYDSLPWIVRPGEYLEIRRVRKPGNRNDKARKGPHAKKERDKAGGEALKGVDRGSGRDGYVFMVGEDSVNVPVGQIQVPESVAAAFAFQHRLEVEIIRIMDPAHFQIDSVELRFSQYLGRSDMWRLGMSLEGTTIHVGERVTIAGQAVRAEVKGIWRGYNRHSSGVVTPKTKTIYRSRSAQVYIFVQLCQETYEFDEDGERYYEKVVHGFLPELFNRWTNQSNSHLVTIILFGRVYYNEDEISYLEEHNLKVGLIKDYAGRPCKDFFRVIIDFERRSDWHLALGDIKRRLIESEKEILMGFHLGLLGEGEADDKKRIMGRWSFAYEGNVLEAVNLALNPFDEHYIDRDLSRTGLSMSVISPGTGHFAVDKNLLRLTTERMVDHGIGIDLICLTKMPLHSVPLFSYVSQKPKSLSMEGKGDEMKPGIGTPDLLYFDAHLSSAVACELADCYSIPRWVNSSFYSKTHDKPFRKDRFVPRCKMYDIQMLGILDHNLTTVAVPLLDPEDLPRSRRTMTGAERRTVRDDFDSAIFGGKMSADHQIRQGGGLASTASPGNSLSVVASYQSARLLAEKGEERRSSLSTSYRSARLLTQLDEVKAASLPRTLLNPNQSTLQGAVSGLGISPVKSQTKTSRLSESRMMETPQPRRNDLPEDTPAKLSPQTSSSLRALSPAPPSEVSGDQTSSGQSTPRNTSVKRLRNQTSKSSFASRFGGNWLFGALGGRSQPSFAAPSAATVGRHDVSIETNNRPASPSPVLSSRALPRPVPVPGAPIITPSTPTLAEIKSAQVTQPLPITSVRAPQPPSMDNDPPRKPSHTQTGTTTPTAQSSKPQTPGDSWSRAAVFQKGKSHVTVNPCNPKDNLDASLGEGRRWQHVQPKTSRDQPSPQHLIKWKSICAPACLPLTTDYMPTAQEIDELYELNSYDIACYSDQVSFLVRSDAASTNLPLAIMREMASQRLSQNFQFIVLPHDHVEQSDSDFNRFGSTRKILLRGDSTRDGLRVGGASEVLRNADGAIYLLWSNHIHRLAFDGAKQSVTVQRFVRKLRHAMEPVEYRCLVWPSQMRGFQEAEATFNYPNVDARLNFNYLDRLIAGEEEDLTASLRYWRTRYILIPSDKEAHSLHGIMPTNESFNNTEVLIAGAYKVLDIFERNQWKPPGKTTTPLRLLPSTFDPSACVLDDGLMLELERLRKGEEAVDGGKALEGMTLGNVGEMMCQPNNGLVIRDRWWNFNVHEDSFTGEQFCQWLHNTFTDVRTEKEAAEWGESLFEKGLIQHVTGQHGFFNYGHIFYRLRPTYDVNAAKRKKASGSGKGWFGGKPLGPRDVIERHAEMSTSPSAHAPLGKLGGGGESGGGKKRIKMSQSVVVDLDPGKRSDRAEVVILHSDIIHNSKNAFHFELNWLGVTAGLLDELRNKCATTAERYGLRFVEAPVEQIKDISLKCAYRSPIPIPLALPPPNIPDLPSRLTLSEHGTGNPLHFFEHAILTQKFNFVLDVEASSRYPESIQVEYTYRGSGGFEYSQFCHKSGLALVQVVGGQKGFLWCDNRLFIAAPTKGRGGGGAGVGGGEMYPNMPVPARLTKQEEARALRAEMERFCADREELRRFYEKVLPPLLEGGGGTVKKEEEVVEVESEKVVVESASADLKRGLSS